MKCLYRLWALDFRQEKPEETNQAILEWLANPDD
jgi:hypothetical protein